MPVNRRGIALMSSAHLVDDFYQGVVPALLPFLVLQRGYSYTAVAGLTLAATLFSSVAQPAFGWWTDRRPRPWLVGVGILVAGGGIFFSGLLSSYAMTWVVIALSGIGIAAFHPEAARNARKAAGESNQAMSIFALGGNVGFALGALIATPVLLWLGLRGTMLLAVPAVAMVIFLALRMTTVIDGVPGHRIVSRLPSGRDDWGAFLRLTFVVVVRAMVFFAMSSFIALYFIHDLGRSEAFGGAALTAFLGAGACGTLIGGWMGDRFGRILTMRLGLALMVPLMLGFVLADNPWVALGFIVLAGVATYLPFSVMVMLGQDYLPNRIGTASGVTVGLAVSIGGLAVPFVGWLGDTHGLRMALAVLVILPVIALIGAFFLREPDTSRHRDRRLGLSGSGIDTVVPTSLEE